MKEMKNLVIDGKEFMSHSQWSTRDMALMTLGLVLDMVDEAFIRLTEGEYVIFVPEVHRE